MSSHKFTNARVHEWLTPELDAVADAMHATRIQLNSAALWWFCSQLSPEDRAEILGEFVKFQALHCTGASSPQATAKPKPATNNTAARSRSHREKREAQPAHDGYTNGHAGRDGLNGSV